MSTQPNSPAPGLTTPQPHAASTAAIFDAYPNLMGKTHAPTQTQGSGLPSLADLTQLMQTLITTTQTLAVSMQGLVNKSNGNHPHSVVEKPQPFKANGSENAWIFWSAFMVFA
jgi:hypothetical protein